MSNRVGGSIAGDVLRHKEAAQREDVGRGRVSASGVGAECLRAEWYRMHWVEYGTVAGNVQRIFQTGHEHEARIVSELKDAGYIVKELDPRTGKQFEFTSHNGMFACKIDGIIKGGGLGDWHILEVKTANMSAYGRIVRHGVAEGKPSHYAQCQANMHLSGLHRCVYIVENKNNSMLYSEIVEYNRRYCELLDEETVPMLLNRRVAPMKLKDDAEKYPCRMCAFKAVCQLGEAPRVNCRSCRHAEYVADVAPDGKKYVTLCTLHGQKRQWEESKAGCGDYELAPALESED